MLYWRPYATIIVRTVLGGFLAGLPQFTEKKRINGVYMSIFLDTRKTLSVKSYPVVLLLDPKCLLLQFLQRHRTANFDEKCVDRGRAEKMIAKNNLIV